MEKTKSAPGFRFRPTDVELVRYYLKRKVMGKKLLTNAIAEIDVYKFEPPDLPDLCVGTGDLKWYFFCPREKKYKNGDQSRRSTEAGYWKVSGKDRDVSYNDEVVGRIRTLVFHYGKTGYGNRSDWVMHEYRLQDKELAQKNVPQDSYVLYKVFKKIGYGPRGSDDYGVPFNEEDWSSGDEDDKEEEEEEEEEEEKDREKLVAIPSSENVDPGPSNGVLSESCVSASAVVPPLRASDDVVAYTPVVSSSPLLEVPQAPLDDVDDDELYSMLGFFTVDEDECLFLDGFDDQNEVRNEPGVPVVEEEAPPVCLGDDNFGGDDLYLELEDLIEPVTPPLPPPSPAQTGENGDLRSNGQS